jgi:hypothetical protein
MRDDKDRSGKWLIHEHGDSILRLAGITGFHAWKAIAPELVAPRQFPDGVLDVFFADRPGPDPFILEIATYPDERVYEQVLRDAMLVLLQRRVVPEVIALVLRPKGNLRISDTQQLSSRHGFTQLTLRSRVIELWTLSATELLAANDVGLIPWVPLANFEGAPEVLVRQCHERIEQQAKPEEYANLVAVTQVMTRLRYNDPQLLTLLGGTRAMIESPLIQELMDMKERESKQESILDFLEARFGTVPPDLAAAVRTIPETSQLRELHRFAALCAGLEDFRTRLDG